MRRLLPIGITVLTCVVGFLQKLPCQLAGWPWDSDQAFARYCYSDVPMLYRLRGLSAGHFPYAANAGPPLEYPVVTGYVMDVTGRLTRLLVPGVDETTSAQAYFLVNVVLLAALAVATVWAVGATLRRVGARLGDALLVAAAPTLALAGTINWDLVAVVATTLAVLAWAYERPVLTGVLFGVGVAAKLFPIFVLGALLLVCLRERRMRAFGRALAGAVGVWTALNLPVLLLYPQGWEEFWRFNGVREADFGSVWFAFDALGVPVPAVNVAALGVLVTLLVAVAALARFARRPPTLAQLGFLAVAAFLLANKVYSPQYVLWMLPLLVLARAGVPWPRVLRDWAIWQAAEIVYWIAVWRYLAQTLTEDWYYPAATLVRVAVTAYLCVQVVRDALAAPAQPAATAVLTAPLRPAPSAV